MVHASRSLSRYIDQAGTSRDRRRQLTYLGMAPSRSGEREPLTRRS